MTIEEIKNTIDKQLLFANKLNITHTKKSRDKRMGCRNETYLSKFKCEIRLIKMYFIRYRYIKRLYKFMRK